MSCDDLKTSVEGSTGVAVMDRPKQLNALTPEMCEVYRDTLRAWTNDDAIKAVVLHSTSEKAFCAGGDVVDVAVASASDNKEERKILRDFFHTEYQMNVALYHFPKPHVSVIDGFCMGGGVGISVHGSHRVVTEKAVIAMPETLIGLFPDVGGTHFLSRLEGGIGMYAGLTGVRLNAADCLYSGFATHFVAHDDQEAFIAMIKSDGVDAALAKYAKADVEGESQLEQHRADIDKHFVKDSMDDILDSLAGDDSEWAQKTLKTLNKMSPLSMKITFRSLKVNGTVDFDAAMTNEFRIVQRCVRSAEFREGVRALLIDKDRSPKWNPVSVAEVSDAVIDEYFQPLRDGELDI